jgi:hypothetical protein
VEKPSGIGTHSSPESISSWEQISRITSSDRPIQDLPLFSLLPFSLPFSLCSGWSVSLTRRCALALLKTYPILHRQNVKVSHCQKNCIPCAAKYIHFRRNGLIYRSTSWDIKKSNRTLLYASSRSIATAQVSTPEWKPSYTS